MKLYDQRRNGFLLLELGISLSLIIFILCLTLPPLITFQSTLVKIELYKLHQFFLRCRQQAMTLNKTISLSFNEHNRIYWSNFIEERLNSAALFGFPPGTYGPPSSPVKQLFKPITFQENCVHFYPDGSMQSGTVYITDRNHSCCYALTVPTGAGACLRMYHYTQRTWHEIK